MRLLKRNCFYTRKMWQEMLWNECTVCQFVTSKVVMIAESGDRHFGIDRIGMHFAECICGQAYTRCVYKCLLRSFLHFSSVKRIPSRTKASFSLFWSWTVWNACCCVFCCLVTWSSSRSKSSVESQRLKMESVLHAASLIGSPKMNPIPAASAATPPMRRRVRLWGSSSSVERFGE